MMTEKNSQEKPQIQLSANAAARISAILAEKNDGSTMLRLAIAGGGCSGFQYAFSLEKERQAGDTLIERDGAHMVVDETSLPFLIGGEVDFVREPIGSYFRVNNPNAVSGCGCGSSFSLG